MRKELTPRTVVLGPGKRRKRQRDASLARRPSLLMQVMSIIQLSAVCARAMAVAGAVLSPTAAAGVAATGRGSSAAASAAAGPGLPSSGKSFATKRARAASAFVSSGSRRDERPDRPGRRTAEARSRAVGFLLSGWLPLCYALQMIFARARFFLVPILVYPSFYFWSLSAVGGTSDVAAFSLRYVRVCACRCVLVSAPENQRVLIWCGFGLPCETKQGKRYVAHGSCKQTVFRVTPLCM